MARGVEVRLIRWVTTVAATAAAGTLYGAAIGALLVRVSLDYPVLSSGYTGAGFRLGLLCGTFLAACQVVTDRPLPTGGDLLRAGKVVCMVTGALFMVALVVVVILSCSKGWLHRFDGLAHPRRYLLYRGIHHAWIGSAFAGTVAGGIFLFCRRSLSRLQTAVSGLPAEYTGD